MHDAGDPGEKKKHRKFLKEYIQFGFTCHVKNPVEHPQCVLCGDVLAHESLKPVKMKRHLETRHPDHAQKPIQFFQRKETALLGQKSAMHGQATVPTKALAASYEVAHLVAKSLKPHTIAESLLLPAAIAMVSAMHGEKVANALKTIPLSNDTCPGAFTTSPTIWNVNCLSEYKTADFLCSWTSPQTWLVSHT